jgi:hypothetical protein
MRAWWSKYYSRPLKDPLLDSYTLEELLYEFHDIVHRKEAEEKEAKEVSDKIEDDKIDQTLAWAEEEERREAELAAQEEELNRKTGIKQKSGTEMNNETFDNDLPEEINTDFTDM